ncbi:MAG: helix-turn-helix domain-containing protein [Pirellulales bacterium]|nr:helix-turn-helix domain-containing protein [Pirellulales bacterium]
MQNNSLPDALALRPREAAKALGVSEKTLWTWTHDNAIPHIRMGRAILYPVDALRRWMDSKTAENSQTGEGGNRD